MLRLMNISHQYKQWFVASALAFSLGGSVVAATTVAVGDANANKRAATSRKAKTTIEKEYASAQAEVAAAKRSPDATKAYNELKLTKTTPTGQRTIWAYKVKLSDGPTEDVIRLTEVAPNGATGFSTAYVKNPLSLRRIIFAPEATTPYRAASVSSSLWHVERNDGTKSETTYIWIGAATPAGPAVAQITLAGSQAPAIDGRIGVEMLRNRAFFLKEAKWLGASAQTALAKIFDEAADAIASDGIDGQ